MNNEYLLFAMLGCLEPGLGQVVWLLLLFNISFQNNSSNARNLPFNQNDKCNVTFGLFCMLISFNFGLEYYFFERSVGSIFKHLVPYKYRVSRKTVPALFTAIFWLLLHLGLKNLTFSWSPFNSDFKTALILVPSIKIDQTSTLRRKTLQLESNIFQTKRHL